MAARVQSQLQAMQENVERWQDQYEGLQGQDLGQVVLDAGRSGAPMALKVPLMEAVQDGGQKSQGCPFLSAVSTLEKTLPQLLAKLSVLGNRGAHNASLALSASISRVRGLIAQARGAASKVGESPRRRWTSGSVVVDAEGPCPTGQGPHEVQRTLMGAAAHPTGSRRPCCLHCPQVLPAGPRACAWAGCRGSLCDVHGQPPGTGLLGGWGPSSASVWKCLVPVTTVFLSLLQATGDYMGVSLRDKKVHWVYRLGDAGPAVLSIDEDVGEQFAAVSLDRWEAQEGGPGGRPVASDCKAPCSLTTLTSALRTLQFGHMSVTVERQMIQETKGDTVAPGAEGLLSLQPDDFVFYVGGYPSNFTVSLPGQGSPEFLVSQRVMGSTLVRPAVV
ncbi:hypothetical protein P7K49_010039 [Saguinus oedipus]|uniref:Laminin domain-containing protein n=1 Tax=Saguinus oedipus TaxID=9490 RepID=A0ABQ9VLN8_SAGOE|nr:hypothetical protein P7K49_010039 [Saguinus oedipus]